MLGLESGFEKLIYKQWWSWVCSVLVFAGGEFNQTAFSLHLIQEDKNCQSAKPAADLVESRTWNQTSQQDVWNIP